MKRILILMLLGAALFAGAQTPIAATLKQPPQKQEQTVSRNETRRQIEEELLTYDSAQKIKTMLKDDPATQLIYTGGTILLTFLLAGVIGHLLRRKWKRKERSNKITGKGRFRYWKGLIP